MIAGAFMLVSIGILIAHAMSAFRPESSSPENSVNQRKEPPSLSGSSEF